MTDATVKHGDIPVRKHTRIPQGERAPLGVTEAQSDALYLRRWIRADACRLAACVWWGRYTEEEARIELRAFAVGLDMRLAGEDRGLHCNAYHVADEELQAALAVQEAAHADSLRLMREAAVAVLRSGGDRREAAEAAAIVAQARKPLPPPHLLVDAVEQAGRELRSAERFWCNRERAA